MNKFVKHFIEENIISIEAEDWVTVFTRWYEQDSDTMLIYYLFSTFLEAGINLSAESLDARKLIIKNKMKEYIENKFNSNSEVYEISFLELIDSLHNRLALSASECSKVLKAAVKETQYNIDALTVVRE